MIGNYNIQQLGSLNVDEAELDEDPQFGKHLPPTYKVDNSVESIVLIVINCMVLSRYCRVVTMPNRQTHYKLCPIIVLPAIYVCVTSRDLMPARCRFNIKTGSITLPIPPFNVIFPP
jgi:hypothetical protein